MTRHLRSNTLALLVLLLAILTTACRSGAGGGGETAGGEATEDATAAGTEAATGGGGAVTTDVGVTEEPCPDAVNPDHGCIYLGSISDLTEGPFAALGKSITDAQKAFWRTVNENGGIGDRYDVDVTQYVRDNKYNPQVHAQVYQEIKGSVLGLAQTLGSPTTAAIIDDLEASNVFAAPATWTSNWAFKDVIFESGTNYCFEAMNMVDYALETMSPKPQRVMAVHYLGDYGNDAAAGVKIAAEQNGLEFINVQTEAGPEKQAGPIDRIVTENPDVVVLTTGPTDAAAIVGQSVARGYQGQFMGSGPTWNPALLQSPAGPALQEHFLASGYWAPFGADTPGHERMREALGTVTPNDGYTSGWAWSYPVLAALQRAAEQGDLSRAGVVEAARSLESIDYEGMLPEGAGNYAAGPEGALRESVLNKVDPNAPGQTGLAEVRGFFAGPTAEGYTLDAPCFTKL